MEQINLLKSEVLMYSTVDNEIKELNKKVSLAREQRSLIEDRMSVILASPEFITYSSLSVNSDNTLIKIRRPGWEKPWSLSRSNLQDLIRDYFEITRRENLNAEDCYNFIIMKNTKKSTEFSFDRIRVSE